MNSNIKDTITTYAAIAMGLCTTIIGLPLAISATVPGFTFVLPSIVNVICGVVMALSIVVTQVLTGKTPSGTTKTDARVIQQNSTK